MRNRLWLLPMLIAPVACMSPRDRARADSVQALAARQLAELKDQQAKLMAENGALSKANEALRDSLNAATTRIAELSASIEKQAETIATLETKMDDLDKQLVAARSAFAKAFYVIGT